MAEDTQYLRALEAYRRGDLEGAWRACRVLMLSEPDHVGALVIAGAVSRKRGEFGQAADYLQRAVCADPRSFEAHAALSSILVDMGQMEAGLEHGRISVSLAPDDPDAHDHLGIQLVAVGQHPQAEECFRAAVALAPEHAGYRRNLATALRDLGRHAEAIEEWNQALSLTPNHLDGWMALGQLQMGLGRLDDAIRSGRRAVEIGRDSAQAHLMLALALSEKGMGMEAEPHLRKAASLDPNDGLAAAALGFWLQEQGRFVEARVALTRAIELRPNHGFAYYNLFRTKRADAGDQPMMERMDSLSASPTVRGMDRAYLEYALGKAHEDLGNWEASIRRYDSANEEAFGFWFGRRPWDREAYASGLHEVARRFTRRWFDEAEPHGNVDETPILVVGMIRSGTSLVEQILSSHPEVVGGGEQTFWHDHERDCEGADGTLDLSKLGAVAGDYLKLLRKLGKGAKRVTDKLPHNYALLGHISSAFPRAKVIHLRRNPADNCFSVYTTAYQKPPAFAHSKENIVFAYREYLRLMEHWREALPPGRMIEVDYEELIADREGVTRRLIEFAGLEWDDACLHHEGNRRAVRTPSLWQVRQPLYTTSIERWRKFEPWIPEFAALAQHVP